MEFSIYYYTKSWIRTKKKRERERKKSTKPHVQKKTEGKEKMYTCEPNDLIKI